MDQGKLTRSQNVMFQSSMGWVELDRKAEGTKTKKKVKDMCAVSVNKWSISYFVSTLLLTNVFCFS